ncbi:MAG: glycosyltransferase family 4 protein [Dehalococcoidia bacterium]|nr:glycosyltransferase family 4 protein [Dehalococcoidia bacterium]
MRRLKIAQVAPPWYPIPPKGYGGIELVVSLLADGLVDAGHDVTVFATGDSKTKGKLSFVYKECAPAEIGKIDREICHLMPAYRQADEFDIIHDHTMCGPAIGNFIDTPMLHTLHGPFTEPVKKFYASLNHGVFFNAISNYQRSCFPELNYVGTIYNSVMLDWYPLQERKKDYLLFLGRMNPEKGVREAVQVANRLGEKLVMVVKMVEPSEVEYFEEQVEPLIGDNVEVIGQVDVRTKARLVKDAKCLLYPIQWPEPFGLVMAEAMACGTPVVAIRNGSVPEVIVDGETGFIVESVDEMVEAVKHVGEIDPKDCRAWVAERFSVGRMVGDYLAAYETILTERGRL